ncbi:MAG: T9SS type A sorting domain-containing protein [Saprospiraceae bacterium]
MNHIFGTWTLKPAVKMNGFLDAAAMDCCNYSKTLMGWANFFGIPFDLELGAARIQYSGEAIPQREWLENIGRTITDAGIDPDCDFISRLIDQKENVLEFYPNPATDILHLNTDSQSQAIIYNSIGQQVGDFSVVSGDNSIPIGALTPGMYFVTLNSGKAVQFFKD